MPSAATATLLRRLAAAAGAVFLTAILAHSGGAAAWGPVCDQSAGSWVADEGYPLYESACPFVRPEFDCVKYGRPDRAYLRLRWQPAACSLPRFDGSVLLKKWRGKRVMFVGDSLSLDQYESLLCLLHAADPNAAWASSSKTDPISSITFKEHNVTVMYYLSHYLVDIVSAPAGRILKLDSISSGRDWLAADVLIFNTWHWWPRRGPAQPWDFIQDGATVLRDMDRTAAFAKALQTWARWVDSSARPGTQFFYQGVSPSHYNGSDWGAASEKTCMGETQPASPKVYRGAVLPQQWIVKKVLAGMRTPVTLLDVTFLSQLRKDGHPSKYNGIGFADDCTHWCIAGVTDTWNVLLYAAIA